jgi:hypothetical protein
MSVQSDESSEWYWAHVLWQKHGLRFEEFAEMPRKVQLAYIASQQLENKYPVNSNDRLERAYVKTT